MCVQASPVLFNPFTAGPTRSGEPSGTLGGSSQGLSLAAASPLLKTMSGSGGSEGTAAQQAALASKLEALERAPPAWLISPGRLVLEQGTSGRLVLLGRGSYGRVYRGWLAPEALPPGAQGADAAAAGGVPVAIKVGGRRAAARPGCAAAAQRWPGVHTPRAWACCRRAVSF